MLYTLSDRILPAYYRDNYFGTYQPVCGKMNILLQPNVIEALHYHSCMELGICICGTGLTYVDNRIYSFSAGDIQVIPAEVPHLSAAAPGVETRWHWISLDPLRILKDGGVQLDPALRKLSTDCFSGLFHPWEHPRLANVIHQLRDTVLLADSYSPMEQTFLSGQLLVECARVGTAVGKEGINIGCVEKIKPAVLYIRENFADPVAMRQERIAAVCDLSVSQFRAVFKRETGMPFRDFIIQTRLAKAAHLLKNTDATVLSIALETGFGQVSCFNRIFAKTFGQTPSAFRKNARVSEKYG